MDLGFYLGELLMQQDEVSVSGLGYFALARKSGHYADDEHKFHPPYNQVEFDNQFITDDTLAQYVAQQKNISITSANYFVEKYVTGLKEQALSEKVAIGNLGWFYTENNRLTFQSVDKLVDDSHFYGLEPVNISKLKTESPVAEHVKPEPITDAIERVIAAHQPVIAPLVGDVPVEEAIEEEEEKKRNPWRWILIVSGILIILAGTIFGLYYYKPDLFEQFILMPNKPKVTDTVKQAATDTLKAPDTAKTDTAKKDTTIKKDTVAKPVKTDTKTKVEKSVNTVPVKTAAPVAKAIVSVAKPATVDVAVVDDAVGTRRFEVIVSTVRSEERADRYIAELKALGLKAWIVPDAPGLLKKVSIGHFKNYNEAKAFGIQAQQSGKVRGESYPLEILPKK
jgi:cell division septation protein DedD